MKRVNNASGYSYMQQKVRKCSEEMALIMEENERLKKNLEESKNSQIDLESKLQKSKAQVYTLEADLFLAKCAEADLKEEGMKIAKENEILKQEQVTVEDVMQRAAIRRKRALTEAKKERYRTTRYVLAAFNWEKETADPVLLEAVKESWIDMAYRTFLYTIV